MTTKTLLLGIVGGSGSGGRERHTDAGCRSCGRGSAEEGSSRQWLLVHGSLRIGVKCVTVDSGSRTTQIHRFCPAKQTGGAASRTDDPPLIDGPAPRLDGFPVVAVASPGERRPVRSEP